MSCDRLCLGIVVLLCWLAGAAVADDVLYKDPNQPVAARVKDLLGRMTMEERIGQMVQIERISVTLDVMRHCFIGSLLSGGGSVPNPHATVVDWINMVNEFQNKSLSMRLGIPMIYGIDVVHGHINVINATIFTHNVGLGAIHGSQVAKTPIQVTDDQEVYLNNQAETERSHVYAVAMVVCSRDGAAKNKAKRNGLDIADNIHRTEQNKSMRRGLESLPVT
ncbi:hypothetical protein SSX86_030328 [Deinandra increscens subsp. villosa]|uniref:Glycoside hydrolase family 3 N-terminal domain-containing protein n=1 Tax=Deinandra increscens subsp. villosa TaxID=3103831 RepID=A0AAP0CAX8_9ASTR